MSCNFRYYATDPGGPYRWPYQMDITSGTWGTKSGTSV